MPDYTISAAVCRLISPASSGAEPEPGCLCENPVYGIRKPAGILGSPKGNRTEIKEEKTMSMIRSTIKKMFLVILAVALLMPAMFISRSEAEENESGWSLVTLEISLRRNKTIAKHGVTIYLDGKQVRHLNQGEMATLNLLVRKGDHRLLFVPDSAKSEECAWELSLLHDEYTLECTLQTHRRYVELKSHRVTANARKLTEDERKLFDWAVNISDDIPFVDADVHISGSI